ncbi:ubiquitin-like protein ATG12 isoform X1 [Ovis aries]|uniref:Autophagy related 12 n=1 Tax=Ovis aries TaxID=9940 RepID=A0AC11DJS6_SHEEP|nr:ubiquitin-like protein ATG12 isoform X1 [Ovis aries]XP_060274725.1 ubiquitin-like protein ATG12 isoform X1 [Ovis aries]
MAEEQESTLLLPPSTAPEAEVPAEVSPETATPEPPSSAAVSPGTEEPVGDTKKKIDILLKAVGDTPIMKTKKWAVERTRTIQGLIDFIKKFLKLVASEQLGTWFRSLAGDLGSYLPWSSYGCVMQLRSVCTRTRELRAPQGGTE